MKTLLPAAIVCLALCPPALGVATARPRHAGATDAAPDFAHFQIILDRMPFGRPPPPPPPPPALEQPNLDLARQQALARQINMSCINVTPGGEVAIGFTDLGRQPPVNHYLLAGSSADGWTVVDADYELEVAIVEKDGVRINLKLGKGPIDNAALQTLIAQADGTPVEPAAQVDPRENLLARRRAETAFKTATEQLLGMFASMPPGVAPPPLPLGEEGDDLDADAAKALATPITIFDDDDAKTTAHRETVAWIKDDMRQVLEAEGGSARSYIERLYARQKEVERIRKEEAARLQALSEKAAQDQVKAAFQSINEQLEAQGIPGIDPTGIIVEEEAQ